MAKRPKQNNVGLLGLIQVQNAKNNLTKYFGGGVNWEKYCFPGNKACMDES